MKLYRRRPVTHECGSNPSDSATVTRVERSTLTAARLKWSAVTPRTHPSSTRHTSTAFSAWSSYGPL